MWKEAVLAKSSYKLGVCWQRKPRETWFIIACTPSEIRTDHLLNTSHKYYQLGQLVRNCLCEEFYFLEYIAVYSVENYPMFRRNLSPPPLFATCFHFGFLLYLLFFPETRADMFLRNVDWLCRRHFVRDDRIVHKHSCENLKSYNCLCICIYLNGYFSVLSSLVTEIIIRFHFIWVHLTLSTQGNVITLLN
jgi:hypothetical protein